MTIVGFIVCGVIHDDRLQEGNPYRLTNAIDYDGNICGIDSGVKNKDYAYYMPDTSVVCVDDCPTQNNYQKFICRYDLQEAADEDTPQAQVDAWENVNNGKCMYEIKTVTILNRCFPDTNIDEAFQGAKNASSSSSIDLNSAAEYNLPTDTGANW